MRGFLALATLSLCSGLCRILPLSQEREEGIALKLCGERGDRPVAAVHAQVPGQIHQAREALLREGGIAERKVCATDRTCEKRIPHDDVLIIVVTSLAGCVSRSGEES